MSTVRAALRRVGAATATGALLAAGSPSATAAPAAGVDEIPILGQAFTMGLAQDGAPAVISVHGVRRVEGATILYWSVANPPGTNPRSTAIMGSNSSSYYDDRIVGPDFGDFVLTDIVGQRAYRALVGDGGSCVCSSNTSLIRLKPGRAVAFWTAATELPSDVTTVAVTIAEQTIPGIPVQDGPMLPLATDQEAVVVGMGWPAIDTEKIATARPQGPGYYPVVQRVSDLERTVTTSEGELSLASDVLFAKNESSLTAKGAQTVNDAAQRIKAADPGSEITVTGHADSDGGAADNLALSKRRATTVANALTAALGPTYRVLAEGKGETEPIASNNTSSGKAKNRRVSITYSEGQ